MFDTFEGMTEPSSLDIANETEVSAKIKFVDNQKTTHNEWCYASLEDVKKNCVNANLNLETISFIKGDVCQTLKSEINLPNAISVLRLDTDFYNSTKTELDVLYPKLSDRGVLIVDDYGRWKGSRKAVDEYFSVKKNKPLFNVVDKSCRSSIKFS